MTTHTLWPVEGAKSEEELMIVLISAANGLKTQVSHSPVLADPKCESVRERLSSIADELFGMQQDIFFARVSGDAG